MSFINYPCKECDCAKLDQLPVPYSHIAECVYCGHPNDMPSDEELDDYRDNFSMGNDDLDCIHVE